MSAAPLGIIAGGGPFPGRVAAAAQAAGRPVFIVALRGFAEPAVVSPFPHREVRMGAAGEILSLLRAHACRDLVLIGPVRRPALTELRPDAEGARLLARIGLRAFRGDDGLLAAVNRVLGEEGFRVLGAHEVLTEAVAPPGVMGTLAPDARALSDIARAVEVIRALGRVDVGQGCVVQDGVVLAVEAIEGTDAMLSRCAALAAPGPGGVLVKTVKPGQDRRADLPTIGPATVAAAHVAGLRGIAVEAGGTLVVDRPALVAEAERLGLFLLGINPDMLGAIEGDQA